MSGQTVKIRSSEGGEFDCYLVTPKADAAKDAAKSDGTMPAIVLASAVHGVDTDIRVIADEFAANGVIAAAPDLFWRTLPGPLSHDDTRTQQRSQPRLEKIKTGERDLVDMLAYLRTLAQFNGQAAVMGFCYGGPYAILGPKRLGYAAGISCHGSQFLDYVGARRRARAGLHHLGRPRQPGAGRGAGRLSPHPRAHEACRGAHLSGRAARLHDARRRIGVRRQDARILHGAGQRHSRRAAQRRTVKAASGVVGRLQKLLLVVVIVARGDLRGVRLRVRYGVLGLQGFRVLDQFDADDFQFLAGHRVGAVARHAAAACRQVTKIFSEGNGHKASSNPGKAKLAL